MTDTPSYEAARDELADIVRKLEAGGGTLEESLKLWERGEELATIAQTWLDGARTRLDALRAEGPNASASDSASANDGVSPGAEQ